MSNEENKDIIENSEETKVDNNEKTVKEKIEKIVEDAKEIVEDVIDGVGETVESAKDMTENFKDKYLKVLAEMENLRKRFDSERSDILKYRASSFIQNILPTVDMFQMAMNSQNASEEVKNWLVGFEMILNNFVTALENEGVKEIKVNKGDDFDANYHHAIEEVECEDVEPGKIVEVKMKGYTLHDKLLRPATVTVAKKAEAEEKVEEKEEATQEENN